MSGLCEISKIHSNCTGPNLGAYRMSRHTTGSQTDASWELRREFRETCQTYESRRPTRANLLGRRPDIPSYFRLPIPTRPIQHVSTRHRAAPAVTIGWICIGETTAAIEPRLALRNNSRPKHMRLPPAQISPATILSDASFSPPLSASMESASGLSITKIW
jgi:hypothetical protein